MKKLYSFVLMATMLLIGTNAWATVKVWTVGNTDGATYSTLLEAIENVNPGDEVEITMTSNEDLSAPVIIPSPTNINWGSSWLDKTGAKITIDLNGKTIKANATSIACFRLYKGELNFTGTGIIEHKLGDGSSKGNQGRAAIVVYGAPFNHMDGVWSNLNIGKNVTVDAYNKDNEKNYGIAIQNSNGDASDIIAKSGITYYQWTLNSHPSTIGTTDLDADINNSNGANKTAAQNAKADGVKFATLQSDGATEKLRQAGCAFGVKVKIEGIVKGSQRGINVVGHINASPKNYDTSAFTGKRKTATYPYFDHNYPYVEITKDAEVSCAASGMAKTGNGAIYAGGYCVMDIHGYVHGQTGVFMKAGDALYYDAVVVSDDKVNNNEAGYNGTVGGSAIFVTSDQVYAGDVAVVIDGDTKVKGGGGSAIVDVATPIVTEQGTTQVTVVEIKGGTIEPGDEATSQGITLTNATGTTATQITGGEINAGTVTVGGVTTDVSEMVPTGSHTTTIVNEAGKIVVVISEGTAPSVNNKVSNADENASIKWQGPLYVKDTIKTDLKLAELEINDTITAAEALADPNLQAGTPREQILVVNDGVKFEVGRVILGKGARIIVEAGGKFIVSGKQGIVAPVAANILLKNTATDQAIFLFNPNVTSNRQPNATVQMYTESKQLTASPWTYTFQRFALPVTESVAPTTDYTDQALFSGETVFESYVFAWNYEQNKWAYLSNWNQLKAFTSYQLANNTVAGGITYTFTGKLHGNLDQTCDFPAQGFGYFGNSHVAPIYINNLIADFAAAVEPTVWIYNYGEHRYDVINADASIFGTLPTEIKSMQAFVLYLKNGDNGEAPVNYASSVWGNPNIAHAPARAKANELSNGALIKVVAEDGMADQVILMEKDSYTNNFDNGADASKCMVQDGINLYVTTANGDQSILASDNLENTILSFKAGEATNYTLQLGTVFGEEYAIRDNVTGAIINCAEGMEYAFYQAANSTVLGRFEIVGRNNAPTAIENTEVKANVKGIYTLMGQYVGENFDILPAGVYVVNGVKIVK